jgi:hypothetical protein
LKVDVILRLRTILAKRPHIMVNELQLLLYFSHRVVLLTILYHNVTYEIAAQEDNEESISTLYELGLVRQAFELQVVSLPRCYGSTVSFKRNSDCTFAV